MKNKRKKKVRQEWEEFQQLHRLSDEDIQLFRHTGYPLDRFRELLGTDVSAQPAEKARQIKDFYQQSLEKVANRQAAIEAGVIPAKTKKPAKTTQHDPKWAEAKRRCRLNMDDIRKAKELGMSPQALIRNVPSASQAWKSLVKDWIDNLYDQRFGSRGRTEQGWGSCSKHADIRNPQKTAPTTIPNAPKTYRNHRKRVAVTNRGF